MCVCASGVGISDLEQGVGAHLIRGLKAPHVGHREGGKLDINTADIACANGIVTR